MKLNQRELALLHKLASNSPVTFDSMADEEAADDLLTRIEQHLTLTPGVKSRHEIGGTVDLADQVIVLDESMMRAIEGGASASVMQHVIDTRESVVREGLMALGWTPPSTDATQH